ncbi:MAG TPA: DNA-binding domain-containing protein [Pseudomonas sp.]|uniref:DNA-binding domain-containing protein n=1 Tax=Pseudomonas sp. TaxID=306 RepID=UPI002ED9259D
MSLADMQRDFRSWLVNASNEAAQRLGAVASIGLPVYQNNYRAQLVGCLEEAFPHVRAWLGDEAFLKAVVTHIDKYPPHAWTLDAYPALFGETLKVMFANNPDIHELAWIELAVSQVFVAADVEPITAQALADVDWDNACLRLTPSLMTHPLTTNAEAIWSALWEKTPTPESEMLETPGGLMVWRRQFTSRLRQLDALEYQALLQVQHDGSFNALCELLVERLGEAEGVEKAGALLASWLCSELIVGVDDSRGEAR